MLELAAIYETSEKELWIHKQQSEIRMHTIGLAFFCSMVLLLSTLLWRTKRYKRIIHRKNESMVSTIGELLNYKEELFLLKEDTRRLREQALQESTDAKRSVPAAAETLSGSDNAAAAGRDSGPSFGD